MKTHTLILAAALICLAMPSTANAERYTDVSEDQQFVRRAEITTRMNAYLLQSAVEAFAEQNEGHYPGNLSEVTLDGRSLWDFLPDGSLLINPFTGARSEPVDAFASTPGQVGYIVIVRCGENVGYSINAWGAIYELLALPHLANSDPCPEPADAEAPADPAQSNEVDDTDE